MLGLILRGVLAAVGVAAVAAVVVAIVGPIDEEAIKKEMMKEALGDAIITGIDRAKKQVTLMDLENPDRELTIQGDEVSDELYDGEVIEIGIPSELDTEDTEDFNDVIQLNMITEYALQRELRERGIEAAIVSELDRNYNTVKLLPTFGNEIDVFGNAMSGSIELGMIIEP